MEVWKMDIMFALINFTLLNCKDSRFYEGHSLNQVQSENCLRWLVFSLFFCFFFKIQRFSSSLERGL